MAPSTSSSLAAILKKTTLDDHEQILAATDKALSSSKSDPDAQHVKVVALLKLDRYNEAVKFIEEGGDPLKRRVQLEYAYALYKTGRLQEAAEISSKLKERSAQHLEAQSRYRLEDPRRTSEIYKQLRSRDSGPEDYDLRVNQIAINAQAEWLGVLDPGTSRKPQGDDLATFETAYNAACGSIAREEFAQAEFLLERAEELCKQAEDLTDQQKADELVPIRAQQLYVYLCRGRIEEAEALAADIRVEETSDASTRKITEINKLLTASLSNPFVTHKAFHTTTKLSQEVQLFSYQSVPLDSNKFTLDLQTYKFHGIISATSKTVRETPTASIDPHALVASFFNAAAHARNGTGKAAIAGILREVGRTPNNVALIFSLVQLYVSGGNITSAVEHVETFLRRLEASTVEAEQEIRFNPVLVSLLVGLYKRRGQNVQIKAELAKAAAYWRSHANPPTSLLTAAGVSLLGSQNEADVASAADIFSTLLEQLPNDRATIAGYVASHAFGAESKVAADVDKLTSISELTHNADVDALESAGIPQSSNALAIAQLGQTKKRAAPDGASSSRKRIRRSRLPKDYDENKKPDPERWLPLKDRSYYRAPKGKKKGKRGGDERTQGGAVNEDLNVESKPSPAPIATASVTGKKKKGKGKK